MSGPAKLSARDRHALASLDLEVRLCISPDPGFYATVRLAVLSLARLGPPFSRARVMVSVGDCATLEEILAANPWSQDYPVEWRVVSHTLFREQSILATHNDRYFAPTTADIVLLCDSDVCLVERIDELLLQLAKPGARIIAASQAHSPPPMAAGDGEGWWRRIFEEIGYPQSAIAQPHAIDHKGSFGLAPHYFNYGFVALSRAGFEAVAPVQASFNALCYRLSGGSYFLAQLSLALMVIELDLQVIPLGLAYNCRNDDEVFITPGSFRVESLEDIRCIHYHCADQLERRAFVCDRAAYQTFLEHPALSQVNQRLRAHLLDLAQVVDPVFPTP